MNLRINSTGTKRWYNEHGELHRTGGPAVIHPDGTQYWYLNGMKHRTDGPAVIFSDGEQYWIHDIQLTEEQFIDITQSEEHLNWYLLKIL
jgi:hypothetical protein